MNSLPTVGATPPYWEENTMQPVKFESCNSNDGEPHPPMKDEPNSLYRFCEGNLNFATVACSEDDSEYGHFHKKNKVSRQDPMSHRIIEKRRRDRMNNCLADLSRLIPADYLKKGRGRIEKTEIIEMAIKHMKYLQQNHQNQSINSQHYRLGFQECLSETMRFLVEVEGFFAREALCVKLISHLQAHCEAVLSSDRLHLPTNNGQPPPIVTTPTVINTTVPLPPPPVAVHVETPHYETNASQLRDMLSSTKEHSPTSTKQDYSIQNTNEQIMYDYHRAAHHQEPPRKETEIYAEPKDIENNNGASLYKFKNNIMQRISQESVSSSLSSHINNKLYKRRKMEMEQTSGTHCASSTTENYCYSENSPIDGSQTSPSSSDVYTRISSESDNPHRVSSPTWSSVSDNKPNGGRQSPKRYSNFPKHMTSRSEIIKPTYRYSPPNTGGVGGATQSDHKNSVPKVVYTKEKPNYSVPIFVLHAKGSFYIPLTIDYNTLAPYLSSYNILDVVPTIHSMMLHPVTINVNFQPNSISASPPVLSKQKYKTENGWH